MTVHKAKDRATFRYKFFIDGQLYRGNTRQITRADAEEFEENEKRRIRRGLAGLPVLAQHTPRFTDWAAVYVKYLKQRGKVRRIDRVEELLRVVLRFWGAKPSGRNPSNPPIAGEPYHNLTLADPIRDPDWIEKFEEWIRNRKTRAGRPVGQQQRLHYMSIMSRMYRVARLPKFRKKTGITVNPFLEVERDRPPGRDVTVTPAELRRWLAHTPKHAQLAIAIAALAPKLRKENVLELRWSRSFDPSFSYITVLEHKTMGTTRQPMIVAIGTALQRLLRAAQKEATTDFVIEYRGKPVREIRNAVKTGAEAAGLTYGRDIGGVTFHTIRHTAATLLAEVPSLTEAQRSATMGQDMQTTQKYTHLRPASQRPVVNRLAEKLQLGKVLDQAFGPGSGSELGRRAPTKSSGQKREKKTASQISRRTRSRQQNR
jgi:integrase